MLTSISREGQIRTNSFSVLLTFKGKINIETV